MDAREKKKIYGMTSFYYKKKMFIIMHLLYSYLNTYLKVKLMILYFRCERTHEVALLAIWKHG